MKKLLERIKGLLLSIPHDKLLHFIAGGVIASFFAIVIGATAEYCVLFSAIAGCIKEAVDEWRKPGAWSYAYLLATILGGLVIQKKNFYNPATGKRSLTSWNHRLIYRKKV